MGVWASGISHRGERVPPRTQRPVAQHGRLRPTTAGAPMIIRGAGVGMGMGLANVSLWLKEHIKLQDARTQPYLF